MGSEVACFSRLVSPVPGRHGGHWRGELVHLRDCGIQIISCCLVQYRQVEEQCSRATGLLNHRMRLDNSGCGEKRLLAVLNRPIEPTEEACVKPRIKF
ncbi:hypothetical protein ElyMa_003625900 [Elysia marginata]|uniref:Uncharacterized protein n=1 Tax=Elysia marginata TaxID=1093978 RepID=A0AAV4ET73_9GAST|nr:hypothetical protein ElyMa_003625900 [Elysia marginata]